MKHLQITARATVVAAVLALVAGCSRPAGKGGRESSAVDGMRNEAVVRTTPVKNQGRSPLCWLYAMLATIESEHLMAGDSVNLSTDYLARQLLADQARTYFFTRRTADVSLRGMASMALQLLQRYGAEDHDAYGNRQPVNYDVLARKVRQVARGAGSVARLDGRLESLLDRETGYVPRAVFMFGAEYTPHEFAHSVCLPGEYLAVTSFTHHPFGRAFVLEVPDNQLRDSFLNVPIGVMMRHVERALRAGHPVCWEGDVSEPGFCFADGIATMPRRVDGASAQALRQRDFEARRTTDDHCSGRLHVPERGLCAAQDGGCVHEPQGVGLGQQARGAAGGTRFFGPRAGPFEEIMLPLHGKRNKQNVKQYNGKDYLDR